MEGRGVVHFWQTRLGQDGQAFRLYKFRSMVEDGDVLLERHLSLDAAARAQWQKYQKLDNDPRITRVGRLIRKLSLDELPQFFNVLKGEMSLVVLAPVWSANAVCMGPAGHTTAACVPALQGCGR